MSDTTFGAFVPGFEFLQGLVKNAGAAIPGFNQWVAPTLNPQELQKRIEELRTVQFWLEQNARMLATTIQALEVQRMTLSTLNAMNVPMGDLKHVLKTPPMPDFMAAAAAAKPRAEAPAASRPEPAASEAPSTGPASQDTPKDSPKAAAKGAKPGIPGVDPMQWWNALTQQFTQIATQAMQDNQLVKQGLDAAGETFRKAAAMPGEMMNQAAKAAQAATQTAAKAARPTAPPAKTASRPSASANAVGDDGVGGSDDASPAPAKASPKTARKTAAPRAAKTSAASGKAAPAAKRRTAASPARRSP